MNDPQTVTETVDPQAKPATETAGAPEKSVDDLLKEFDTKTEPTKTTPPAEDDRLTRVFDYVEAKATEDENRQTETDIASAVKAATGDRELDPEYVEGKLHYKANTDPAFRNAWMQRHANPEAWGALCKAYGKELAATSKVDQPASEDRAALSAAVRSQSTKPAEAPPSEKDIRRMTDSELAAHKRSLLRG